MIVIQSIEDTFLFVFLRFENHAERDVIQHSANQGEHSLPPPVLLLTCSLGRRKRHVARKALRSWVAGDVSGALAPNLLRKADLRADMRQSADHIFGPTAEPLNKRWRKARCARWNIC